MRELDNQVHFRASVHRAILGEEAATAAVLVTSLFVAGLWRLFYKRLQIRPRVIRLRKNVPNVTKHVDVFGPHPAIRRRVRTVVINLRVLMD
jgi:hypothetical protein